MRAKPDCEAQNAGTGTPTTGAQNAGTGTPTSRSPECGHWHAHIAKPRMRALARPKREAQNAGTKTPKCGPTTAVALQRKAQKTDIRSSFTTCGAHFVTAQLHKVSESESQHRAARGSIENSCRIAKKNVGHEFRCLLLRRLSRPGCSEHFPNCAEKNRGLISAACHVSRNKMPTTERTSTNCLLCSDFFFHVLLKCGS